MLVRSPTRRRRRSSLSDGSTPSSTPPTTPHTPPARRLEFPSSRELAIVTGGGGGIGRIISVALLREGFDVLICGRRHAIVPGAEFVLADVSTAAGRAALVEATDGRPVRFLVQNAGAGEPATLENLEESMLDAAWRTNVSGPLLLARDLRAQLTAAYDARILHLGTSVAFRPQIGTSCYGITKAAFHRSYEQLNVELRHLGISAGSLSPGLVDTEGVRAHVASARACGLPHVAYFDEALGAQPPRVTPPERLAACVLDMLLRASPDEFAAREWSVRAWHQQRGEAMAMARRRRRVYRLVSASAALVVGGLVVARAVRGR